MPFDSNRKILFIHIPKTGGTSIEQYFDLCHAENFWYDRWDRDRLDFVKNHHAKCNSPKLAYEPQHYTPEILKALVDGYDDYFKFTFVRNPYTRLLSEYYWRENKKYASPEDFDPVIFDRWTDAWLSDLNDSHKEPQVNYIDPSLDFIGRFEQIEVDFAKVLLLLTKKQTGPFKLTLKALPNYNSTGIQKSEIIPHLLERTKKRIKQSYFHDFEKFNYDF